MLDKGLCILVESTWERNFPSEDILVDSHRVFIVERIDSSVHFIDQDTESPPVNSFSVTLVQNDLWSNVLRSSADSESSSFIQYFGKSEIGKFKIAVIRDKKIFWFEVSKDNIFAV